MFFLNEKIRNVLSLAFQRFHKIFEEIFHLQTDFQNELDREFSTLIDRLTLEMQLETEKHQRENEIDENEIVTKIRACFQEISFNPSMETLWQELFSFLNQSFVQMVRFFFDFFFSFFQTFVSLVNKSIPSKLTIQTKRKVHPGLLFDHFIREV